MMPRLRWMLPAVVLGVCATVALDAPGGDAGEYLAQSESIVTEGMGGSDGPNPSICAQCYEQLKKDNSECETLRGQDWKFCRDAATTAYRRCSAGC